MMAQDAASPKRIEQLLADQLNAVEKALSFNRQVFALNQAITQRLATCSVHEIYLSEHSLRTCCDADDVKKATAVQNGISVETLTAQGREADIAMTLHEGLAQPLLLESRQSSSRSSDERTRRTSKPVPPVQIKDSGANASPLGGPQKLEGRSERLTKMFPKLDEIKEVVHQTLEKPRYNVEDFYHTTGVWQYIAKSGTFTNIALMVIALNTIWIGVDTDLNKAAILCNAGLMFQIVDNVFCVWFCVELFVRFMAFKSKCCALRDTWFVFDALLVMLMVWETWVQVFLYRGFDLELTGGNARSSSILRIVRVFRLSRVARTARLLHHLPELLILVRGMFIAMRSVVAVLCLLALVIYIFAIIFVELLEGLEPGSGRFDNVPQAMNFLLIQVVCGFEADVFRSLLAYPESGWIFYILFLSFYIMGSLTMMNMLIGILCEVVATVANVEKDNSFQQEVHSQITSIAKKIGIDSTATISKNEFERLIKDFEGAQSLNELGVDVLGCADFASFIFEECDEMPYSDFLQMVIQFRGAKQATVKDMMDIRKYISVETSALGSKLRTNSPHSPERTAVSKRLV